MLSIFLVPLIGIIAAVCVVRFFPKAQFKGSDLLPFFFIPACNLITNYQARPSFLPYGFLFYFILVIIISIMTVVREKNISLSKTFHELWKYLSLCSVVWYLGLLVMMI